YITTPIFYVNSVPHIGHLYTTVVADTLARWYRFRGHQVRFATGTDEHGLKIQQAATNANLPPQEFCDGISLQFRSLFDRANISYTDYIRTTEPRHHKAVQSMWQTLNERNLLRKSTYSGYYSVSDEAFVPQTDVIPGRKPGTLVARDSGQPVEHTSEDTYVFGLDQWKSGISAALDNGAMRVVPSLRERDVRAFLAASDLADLSVSRPSARVGWGIPVPNDASQTVYVWLDALTNYLTILGYPNAEAEVGEWWSSPDTDVVHVIGKEIAKFHAVYWPAFLLAAGIPLPGEILTHAHWTVNKTKMSKSIGNVVDPNAVMDRFGVDPVRFYLMLNGGVENDGDWSEDTMAKLYRKELAGQIGNLFSRATSDALVTRSGGGMHATVPLSSLVTGTGPAQTLHSMLAALPASFDAHMSTREFNKAIMAVVHTVAAANRYFADQAPWSADARPEVVRETMAHALETLRVTGLLMQCVMPDKMTDLLDRVGQPAGERGWYASRMGSCAQLGTP
ncbi:tRNA synthetases class I (M)-domain-containing protein, partial [Blastocladiella britannica]